MNIVISTNGLDYEERLVNGLNSINGIKVIDVDSLKFLQFFYSYCETTNGGNIIDDKENEQFCFIIDSLNNLAADCLAQMAKLSVLKNRPRIILISSVLTWGDGRTASSTTGLHSSSSFTYDPRKDFPNRNPVAGFSTQYMIENSFWEMARTTQSQVIIVGTGLFYGQGGLDFEDLFRYIKPLCQIFNLISVINNFCYSIFNQLKR